MGGIRTIGAALGVSFALGGGITMASSRIQGAAHDRRNEQAARGDESARRRSDALVHNFDGGIRATMGAASLLTLPVAAIARRTGHLGLAGGALGVGLGLAGAALFAGNGGRVMDNISSSGNALNAWIHSMYRPQNPTVAEQLPLEDAARHAPKERRVSPDEMRAVKLRHLPGTPDMARAEREAERTLASLDFSKRDLVLWVPGTGEHKIADSWKEGVDAAFGDRASQAFVDYPAEWNLAPSAATGMETLRLVLAGIAERGGDHRVLLAGQSQGAWVIGDVMAEPELRAVVDRAVLFGQPGVARTDYAHRRDPKVVEVSDPNDAVTWDMAFEDKFLRGMELVHQGGELLAAPDMLDVALGNPEHGAYFAAKLLDPERWRGDEDPHQYAEAFADGARWLHRGAV